MKKKWQQETRKEIFFRLIAIFFKNNPPFFLTQNQILIITDVDFFPEKILKVFFDLILLKNEKKEPLKLEKRLIIFFFKRRHKLNLFLNKQLSLKFIPKILFEKKVN